MSTWKLRVPPVWWSALQRMEPRELHPIIRDDIYKLSAEALRNAFRHAHANNVEVEIHYDKERFRLLIRDDGRASTRQCLRRVAARGTTAFLSYASAPGSSAESRKSGASSMPAQSWS